MEIKNLGGEQKGFSMIEVMISVFILSVGILGMAGLQLQSLKYGQQSEWRSQATVLAYDIAERVRTNRSDAASYAIALTGTPPAAGTLAQNDLNEWITNINTNLPNGKGAVVFTGNLLQVTVQVDDERKISNVSNPAATPSVNSFVYITQLDDI